MKRSISLVIALILIISAGGVLAEIGDHENNWAKGEINYMLKKGVIVGYPDGSFKPKNNMTNAEFYTIINGLIGYSEKAEIEYKDVDPKNWYYDEIAKAFKANYISASKVINPRDNITRGEVVRIIGRVFDIEEDTSSSNQFLDSKLIPNDIKAIIGGLRKMNYLAGYPDGTFRHDSEITRAEVVKLIKNVSGEIINQEGSINKNIKTNLLVNKKDVILKDMIIDGDLYLTEGIGEGDITLDNVEVKGQLKIKGGGENSIIIKNSKINKVLIDKHIGRVRVVFENTMIEQVNTLKEAKIELIKGTKIESVRLDGKVELAVEKGTRIVALDSVSKDVSIESKGNIDSLKTNTNINVNGEIVKADTEIKIDEDESKELSIKGEVPSSISGGGGEDTLIIPTIRPSEPITPTTPEPTRPTIDKNELERILSQIRNLKRNDYTGESWMSLEIALGMSEKTQKEVDYKLRAINSSFAGLIRLIGGNYNIDGDEKLEDISIEGDLIIDGGGNVELKNVEVKGSIIVKDVSSNSLHLNDVKAKKIDFQDTNGGRITTSKLMARENSHGLSQIDSIEFNVQSETPILLEGDFGEIEINVNESVNINLHEATSIAKIQISEGANEVKIESEGGNISESIGSLEASGKISEDLTAVQMRVESNKADLKEMVNILKKIPAESTENMEVYLDRGRQVKYILEKFFKDRLGSDYENYSEHTKIRTANTLRSFMQHTPFRTVKQVEVAFEEAKKWNRVFEEGMKYKAYFAQSTYDKNYEFPLITKDKRINDNITETIWENSDGISDDELNNDITIKLLGTADMMGPDTFSNPGNLSEYLAVEGDMRTVRLIKQNDTNRAKQVYILVEIFDSLENKLSYTNFIVKLEPQEEEIKIIGINSINYMEVDFGTPEGDLDLPTTIELKLSDGRREIVDVEWYSEKYDFQIPGEYIFEGKYEMPERVRGNKPTVSVKVILKENLKVLDDENVKHENVDLLDNNGNTIEYIDPDELEVE